MAFVRDTAHLSISVHGDSVPEPEAMRFVDARRRHAFGTMDGGRVALVRYRPRAPLMGLEIVHTVE